MLDSPKFASDSATFQISAHSDDYVVHHEGMDKYRAQGGRKSDEQGTHYRDLVRIGHFANCAGQKRPAIILTLRFARITAMINKIEATLIMADADPNGLVSIKGGSVSSVVIDLQRSTKPQWRCLAGPILQLILPGVKCDRRERRGLVPCLPSSLR